MLEQIKNIFNQIVPIDNDVVFDEKTIILRDLNINSLELISLICAIEDDFDIEISDKEIRKIITIGDLIAFIESCQ